MFTAPLFIKTNYNNNLKNPNSESEWEWIKGDLSIC